MSGANRRLTSWKEISAYLGRDVRTVARWERERGLPVHRLPGGRGSTVFAWSDEIDAWLGSASRSDEAGAKEEPNPPSSNPEVLVPEPRWPRLVRVTIPAGLLVVLLLGLFAIPWSHGAEHLSAVAARGADLVAISGGDRIVWRHTFGEPIRVHPEYGDTAITDIDGDGSREVLAVVGGAHDPQGHQSLYCFSESGALRWFVSPQDAVVYGSETYGPPWNSAMVLPYGAGPRKRIIWLTHHHTWWPGVARLLDATGREISRFVNPGWLTSAAVTASGRVLLAGTNNAENADVFAVLDDQSWPGAAPTTSPEGPCRNCPSGLPLRYFVLPRSELRKVWGATTDPAAILPYERGPEVEVHAIEADSELPTAAVVLDFSADFTPLRARASDPYWAWHARLEQQGRIHHRAADCPERRGFTIREWQRGRGWSEVFVPSDDATKSSVR